MKGLRPIEVESLDFPPALESLFRSGGEYGLSQVVCRQQSMGFEVSQIVPEHDIGQLKAGNGRGVRERKRKRLEEEVEGVRC